jgi:hypothetical protein
MTPAELKANVEAATPLPWDECDDYGHYGTASVAVPQGHYTGDRIVAGIRKPDAAAICALRNAGPLLVELWETMDELTGKGICACSTCIGDSGRERIIGVLAKLEALKC